MATKYDLRIDQGATKRVRLVYRFQDGVDEAGDPIFQPHSLTGCTARMQVRKTFNEPILVDLSTENGSIVLEDGAQGQIDITMSAAQTEALELRKAIYDLELVFPSGDVARLLQGNVLISPNVTE